MNLSDHNRYIKLDADSNPLPRDAIDFAQVQDPATNLIWLPRYLDDRFNWSAAQTAASAVHNFGFDTWRCPTPNEASTIVDYSRFGPAVNTDFFQIDSDWIWTSSRDAESPQAFAWLVNLYSGYAFRDGQYYQGRVLVVRSAPLPRQ